MKKLLVTLSFLSFALCAEASMVSPEVITLTKRNTLVFRGVVTSQSVAKMQIEAMQMSAKLYPSETIYLVLDTPGGSVSAGNEFIDFMKALPQKTKTITLFAASMGFHIAQNLDERLILPSSTMMSHRASMSGLEGELPGELLSRLSYTMRELNRMDEVVATRMKVPLAYYQNLIRDELWLKGSESLRMRVVDRVVLARCDSSFQGTNSVEVGNFLGIPVMAQMHSCPLITGALSLSLAAPPKEATESEKTEALGMGRLYASDKKSFVKKFISTGRLVFKPSGR